MQSQGFDSGAGQYAPGWYPDPSRRFEFRYHNGQQWTADVSSAGSRGIDHDGLRTSPVPGGVGGPPPSRAAAIAAFVLGLAGIVLGWAPFVFALAAVGAVIGFIFGILGIRAARRQNGEGKKLAVAGLVMCIVAVPICVFGGWFTLRLIDEINDYLEPGPYELTTNPCTSNAGLVTFDGTITNLSEDARGYTLRIDYRRNGALEDRDDVAIRVVQPGETVEWEATTFIGASGVVCDVTNVLGPPPFDTAP